MCFCPLANVRCVFRGLQNERRTCDVAMPTRLSQKVTCSGAEEVQRVFTEIRALRWKSCRSTEKFQVSLVSGGKMASDLILKIRQADV